jgi:hypothetical protein
MTPIFLNYTWSHHERALALSRRRQFYARAILFTLNAAAWISLGIGLGAVLTH